MDKIFKLPIFYNNEKESLSPTIIGDLELNQNIDSGVPMYKYAFQPKTVFGELILNMFACEYTTDVVFLKDTQKLLKTYKEDDDEQHIDYSEIYTIWKEIKIKQGFTDKYQYIDWPAFDYLNTYAPFLQFMSIYNLASPVISLFIPIILLIVPFFIIKLRGLEITISKYADILKQIASNHAIGKLFTKFSEVETSQKVYLLISAGFYLFSIYQNIMTCFKFNNNMIRIQQYLNLFKEYITHTEKTVDNFIKYSGNLLTYSGFVSTTQYHLDVLRKFKNKLECIIPYNLTPIAIAGLGHSLACFYDLHCNSEYNDAFLYTFGFNGYIDNIKGFIENIQTKFISPAKFTKKQSKALFKGAYYPALMRDDPVKNTYHLQNMIITGPNAAGKTTILKATLINVIISQQMGCGFYDAAVIFPFKHIHCYLNIPDTSGRDSLFQAECRRCKEIIDCITKSERETHFCVFDELYSGTNPDEAVSSSKAFMKYLINRKIVTSILTTHFTKICTDLENENIKNYFMGTLQIGSDFKYSFELKRGISNVKGGAKVLKDMEFPEEIINSFANE